MILVEQRKMIEPELLRRFRESTEYNYSELERYYESQLPCEMDRTFLVCVHGIDGRAKTNAAR
jgi:hypothetical protein